jgi:H+-translocating diphosphatase
MVIFCVLFGLVIFFLAETNMGEFWTLIAFEIGAVTSIISGYIGMRIAVAANVRTTKECAISLSRGFVVAYKAGSVLGFTLVGMALMVLVILMIAYRLTYLPQNPEEVTFIHYQLMFEKIAGYGLGGSVIALFGRVGGGIYTKAADVGSDLAGKVVKGLPEDDRRNPGTIADNVGDNVGDIAGMGADLFGSLAESSCAALVVSGTSADLVINSGAYYFPLCITAFGIIACIVTWFFATQPEMCCRIERFSQVEKVIKGQLIISTLILIPGLFIVTIICLPPTFTFDGIAAPVNRVDVWICCMCGLLSGLIIGVVTEYYTSNEYAPVKELAESCKKGAAPNIIKGLALGYLSNTIPVICLAITIYISFKFADMYGIALAALGMLSNLCTCLTIDGYGPISDNAGGIAEMSHLHLARVRTDKLDAAGNTTAAIGKGFAIGSACLVSLALFGAFATRCHLTVVNVLEPLQFSGLVIGAMLPFLFTALTMKAVGTAAEAMIDEIVRQDKMGLLKEGAEPDYAKCIEIATQSSLKEMFPPGLLVICAPIFIGLLFGPKAVAGMLAGSIVAAIQMAFSQSNTGGAWDNTKKYIEAGHLKPDITDEKDEEGRPL